MVLELRSGEDVLGRGLSCGEKLVCLLEDVQGRDAWEVVDALTKLQAFSEWFAVPMRLFGSADRQDSDNHVSPECIHLKHCTTSFRRTDPIPPDTLQRSGRIEAGKSGDSEIRIAKLHDGFTCSHAKFGARTLVLSYDID